MTRINLVLASVRRKYSYFLLKAKNA